MTVSAELSEALCSMRDVRGVQGSFVVSDFGRLLARDMPAMFGDDILGEAGPRALRLRETLAYGGQDVHACTLRFADFFIFVRPLRDGLLCVLTGTDVNPAVMRMAINLAIRRLNVLLDTANAPSPGVPTRAPVSNTAATVVAPMPRAPATGPAPAAGLAGPTDSTRVGHTQEISLASLSRTDAGDKTAVRMYRGRPLRQRD